MTVRPDFALHRQRCLDALHEGEAVLLFGAHHAIRNYDAEYPYRPDSDFYWLTGWPDPECALLLKKGEEPFTLFVQKKDREREVWTGFRPGPEGARETYGADNAFEYGELQSELSRLLQGVHTLHYAFGQDHAHDTLLLRAISTAGRSARYNGCDVPVTFHSPAKLLHELRLVKSEDELAVLRNAASWSAEGHRLLMAQAAPGVMEYELATTFEHHLRKQGSTGMGYNPIVGGGANACILHYITNDRPLVDGDLVLVDAGGEHCFYTADITRTFPVNGTFTEVQRRVYQIVLDAQLAAIDKARPGRDWTDMHDTAIRVLTEGMVALGLLEGEVDELIREKTYKRYYMHGTGHWLGLDVHDAGRYAVDGHVRVLAPGMVVTVEPGLYIPPDDEDAPEELRGIGIRIEDDILVTDGEPVVLTAACPKTIEEVEAACRA